MNRWATTAVVALAALTIAAVLATLSEDDDGPSAIRMTILIAIALLGAFLPLSGALDELRHPQDHHALEVDTNYSKDDRYFAVALESAIAAGIETCDRMQGRVEITSPPRSTLDVDGAVWIAPGAAVEFPVVATREITASSGSRIHALKSRRGVLIERGVSIARWLDSGGVIRAAEGSDLGARATATRAVQLQADVRFRLLRAQRIRTDGSLPRRRPLPRRMPAPAHEFIHGTHRVRADGAVLVDGPVIFGPRVFASGDVIARGDVTIGEGATLDGSIHSDGGITIEANAIVTRSLYAEGDIDLQRGAVIGEHVVSRGSVRAQAGAVVGTMGRITTLLADRNVMLGAGVTVYGRVVAGGTGRTTA